MVTSSSLPSSYRAVLIANSKIALSVSLSLQCLMTAMMASLKSFFDMLSPPFPVFNSKSFRFIRFFHKKKTDPS